MWAGTTWHGCSLSSVPSAPARVDICASSAPTQVWKKGALAKAGGFFVDMALRSAFNTWRGFSAYQEDLAAKAELVVARWSSSCLAAAWAGWRQAAQRRRYQRQVLMAAAIRLGSQVLAAAFAGWRERVEQEQQRSVVLGRAVEAWRGRTLRGCFQHWQHRAAELQDKKGKLASAVALWQRSRLASAWAAWAAHHSRFQTAQAVACRFQKRQLALAWAAWRGWAAKKGCLQGRLEAALQRWARQAASKALLSWREYAAQKQERLAKLQVCLQKLLNYRLLAAFAAFR